MQASIRLHRTNESHQSESQRILQRNIDMQSMLIRAERDSAENQRRLAMLEKLSRVNACLAPSEFDSFIRQTHYAVDAAFARAECSVYRPPA
jgi:hypothetical protein